MSNTIGERRHISAYRVKGVDTGWWVRIPAGTFYDADAQRTLFEQKVFYHQQYAGDTYASLQAARDWRDRVIARRGRTPDLPGHYTAKSVAKIGRRRHTSDQESRLPPGFCEMSRERKTRSGNGVFVVHYIKVAVQYKGQTFQRTFNYGTIRTREEAIREGGRALKQFRETVDELITADKRTYI